MQKLPQDPTNIEKLISWIGSTTSLFLHTIVFASFFLLAIFRILDWNTMLLVLTTALSLEAIYLAIFIQMTVNRNTQSLREVEEDIDEIQEDVEELGEDVDEIQEDIEEMSEDLEELSEEDAEENKREEDHSRTLEQLTSDIRNILNELEGLKKKK